MDETKVNAFQDAVREALRAENFDGYVGGRYTYDHNTGTPTMRRKLNEAHAKRDEAVAAMWRAFYAMMDKSDQPDTDEGTLCIECEGTDGRHFLNCSVWPF